MSDVGEGGEGGGQFWGTPEADEFYERWTRRHIDEGITTSYYRAMEAYADDLPDEDEAEEAREAARAELPLHVGDDLTVASTDMRSSWTSLFLQRVNTDTGETMPGSEAWVADIAPDDEIVEIYDNYFSDDQASTVLEQYQEQRERGI